MMFGVLSNMKRKMMIAEAFVLFSPVTTELNDGSYTVAVLGDIHAKQILMRNYLTVIFLFLEVLMQFPYSLLFI